jgi:ornithine carbamoyltransferase
MRHVLSLHELTSEEIREVLDISTDYKSKLEAGDRPALLAGHTVGLLFEKPSLRTRVSFETLTTQLGGNSLFLGQDVGWGSREPLCDFMPILTSYLDLLVIRAKSHAKVEEAVAFSRCPVINGLTDISHPCQAFADLLTVKEIAGDKFLNSHITYVGDANNVTYSLALICSKLGIRMSIAAPEGYQFESSFIAELNEQNGNSLIKQTANIAEAVDGANFVYTDVWTSMGQEAESKQRLKDLADYQVNDDVMNQAADGAKFLHCLPARRGEEVASTIIDSDRSAIIQQANNRLHAQKGLVIWLLRESSSE